MQRTIMDHVALTGIITAPSPLAQGLSDTRGAGHHADGAGGSLDIMARTLAQSLSGSMGQQFYVENKVGAGGNQRFGARTVHSRRPYDRNDYCLPTASIRVSTDRELPFDALNDFEFLRSSPS
jgi:tripartite-type tricarboxylate transporter receptor subunit TctC